MGEQDGRVKGCSCLGLVLIILWAIGEIVGLLIERRNSSWWRENEASGEKPKCLRIEVVMEMSCADNPRWEEAVLQSVIILPAMVPKILHSQSSPLQLFHPLSFLSVFSLPAVHPSHPFPVFLFSACTTAVSPTRLSIQRVLKIFYPAFADQGNEISMSTF